LETVVYRVTTAALQSSSTVKIMPITAMIDKVLLHFPAGCFKAGTNILMDNGSIEKIEQVKIGMNVACHNSHGKVLNTYKRDYSGDIYKIDSLEVTPEHPFLAVKKDDVLRGGRTLFPGGRLWNRYRSKPSWEPKWIKAKHLSEGDFVVSPILKDEKDVENIDLSIFMEDKEYSHNEIKKVRDKEISDGYIRNKYGKRKIKRYIDVDELFLRLAGYYLSDGSLRYSRIYDKTNNSDIPTGISFTFCIDEDEYVDDVVSICNTIFGIKPYVKKRKNKNVTDINLTNVLIARMFKQLFGEHFDGKFIHPMFMKLPLEKQRCLIDGIWRGDGTVNKTNKTINLKNERLLYQVYTILNRLRLYPSLFLSSWSVSYLENCINQHKFYHNGFLFKKIHKINKENYDGKVYNLNVDKYNSYIANNLAVHNCNSLVEILINHGTVQIFPYPPGGLALNDVTPEYEMNQNVVINDSIEVFIQNHDNLNPHTVTVTLHLNELKLEKEGERR